MDAGRVAKLVGGSAVVYAVVASVPASPPREATCNGYASHAIPGSLTTAAASEAQSGSRLQPVYLEGDDGSRQFMGWFDTTLRIDCSFAMATDGAWRCLPAGADAGRFYSDAACTQRLATVHNGCNPPVYADVEEVPACGWQLARQLFTMGDRYTGPLAYWKDGGACAAVTSADIVAYDLYRVTD